MQFRGMILLLALASVPGSMCAAQQRIDPDHKFSWSENCGWMNWDGAPVPGQSVSVFDEYLTGHIWCENVGWIVMSSSGAPSDGHAFANTSGEDHGVNLNGATGALSGFAWSENIGWINFSGGGLASPPNPARLDSGARRFPRLCLERERRMDQPRRCRSLCRPGLLMRGGL